MKLRRYIYIFSLIGYLAPVTAFIPDLAFSQKILKDNHYFLHVLNQGISNFGTDKEIALFKEATQLNYNAHLYHVSNDFKNTYLSIRKSQEILRDLYYNLLVNHYYKDCRKILDTIAPIIIDTRDNIAAKFLMLGYRDLRLSKKYLRFGRHTNRFLFSIKIRYYINAVKLARRAKRYAFLALIESKTPYAEKKTFKKVTLDDVMQKEKSESQNDYSRVKNMLVNNINRKLIINSHDYFNHHNDNYGYITRVDVLKENMEFLTSKPSDEMFKDLKNQEK